MDYIKEKLYQQLADWNAPLPASLADLGFDYHYIMAATADSCILFMPR